MGVKSAEALDVSFDELPNYLHAKHSVYMEVGGATYYLTDVNAVSYTHLDVYKRQGVFGIDVEAAGADAAGEGSAYPAEAVSYTHLSSAFECEDVDGQRQDSAANEGMVAHISG